MENRPYIIISDTTGDLPMQYVKDNGLGMMAISYEIDGVEYDGMDHILTPKEFYEKMRSGSMPKTQQINPDQSGQYFTRMIEQGYDILYIAFSSALSGTYQSALTAREEVLEKHPNARIEIFDSLSASVGEGLLVHKALQQKQKGATLDELLGWLSENVQHLATYFTVDDLFHLHRGGRVSKTAAVVGSMLGIKPVLYVSPEGKLEPVGKVRGRKQSLTALVDYLSRLWLESPENDTVFISHGDAPEDAQFVASLVRERVHPKEILVTDIGPCIGAHSGPGTIALFFYATSRD